MPETPPSVARLRIEPLGCVLPVPAGMSLLEAADAAGVRLPRSCRNGSCRACRCQLTAGDIRYRIDWPGLSAEERAQGEVLPCVAEALGDVTLLAPGAQQR
ncbi:2Fe-2S iron-sulfur cluster-binding protein [Ideonella sp. B508-1]|uniref:2Fe-2S iron-sulfur cluster-binding protein n=1 Tax=Ideonella sp. B508-1 TaxID=137716 RepID=UPI0003B6BEDF|nr:2Fe-2S iron-sulfur cluster-binding protein [Ideonella sp. B508-1]